jgi:hypothetical protein
MNRRVVPSAPSGSPSYPCLPHHPSGGVDEEGGGYRVRPGGTSSPAGPHNESKRGGILTPPLVETSFMLY